MADYEITVEGKRGSALLPFAEELGQIAADNARPSDEAKFAVLVRSPERIREQIAGSFYQDYTTEVLPEGDEIPGQAKTPRKAGAPFIVAGERIILKQSDWGINRPEVIDVQTLSTLHPDETFYFTVVSPNGTRVAIEGLENFWRGRIQEGRITANYDASPVVWTERVY